MKTRSGFVSNSSSSSFVILGCLMSELPLDHPAHQDGWEWAEGNGMFYTLDARLPGIHRSQEVIGEPLVAVGEYSQIDGKALLTMREMCDKAIKVADRLGVDPERIQFITASYSC